jgi:hypothetical protein
MPWSAAAVSIHKSSANSLPTQLYNEEIVFSRGNGIYKYNGRSKMSESGLDVWGDKRTMNR